MFHNHYYWIKFNNQWTIAQYDDRSCDKPGYWAIGRVSLVQVHEIQEVGPCVGRQSEQIKVEEKCL